MKSPLPVVDPRAALEKAVGERSAVELKVADLGWKRQQALVEADDLASIEKFDAEIARHKRTLGILNDRIEALKGEIRRLEIEQLEREREQALVALQEEFDKSAAAAKRLEKAVEELGNSMFDCLEARERALLAWPENLPKLDFQTTHRSRLMTELGYALYFCGRPTAMSGTRLPMPSSAGLGVQGIEVCGVAACVESENAALIDALKTMPLVESKNREAA
jgi:hypothetical protein